MYMKGAKFERKVAALLKKRGAIAVVRSAGSRGPIDLVALWEAEVDLPWIVQCKLSKAGLSKEERIALVRIGIAASVTPILAYKDENGKIQLEDIIYERTIGGTSGR